jgi:LPS O-antigen subunit length determinant protein (WzzB/FepE family)
MKEHNLKEILADEIDLISIIAIIWKSRKLIIFGAFATVILSAGASFLIPRAYRSEGFYQLGNPTNKIIENTKRVNGKIGNEILKKIDAAYVANKTSSIGVPVPLYKSSSTQFFNPNRFQLIAKKSHLFKEAELKKIATDFRTAEDISRWIKPVYAFAKDDSREFTQLPQDQSNSVIGLNLSYEADSPENASLYVTYFGRYVRDCLLYATLYNYVMDGYSNGMSGIQKIENEIIDMKFQLVQNANKLKDIRSIIANYPDSAKIENRQLVSIQEGGDRFLSPVTQLVGIESILADLRRDLAELERERDKLTARAEYFSRCYDVLKTNSENGESLFLMLKAIKESVFSDKDLGKDEIKEAFNNISIDLQTFDLNFYFNSRFVSGPTIPEIYSKPRRSLIVILSFVISLFSLVIFVLIADWWKRNKSAINLMPGPRLISPDITEMEMAE